MLELQTEPGFESPKLYLTLVPQNGILYPWSGRSPEQWMSLVKETEARRLFGSAPPNPKSLAEWVERFQLKTAVQTYWGSLEKTPLRSSLELDTRYQEEA